MKRHERRTHSHLLNSVTTALFEDDDDDDSTIEWNDNSGDLKHDKILMKVMKDGVICN